MVTKIELKMLIPPVTTRVWLLGHSVALNGEVHHYVMRDGFSTPCGMGIIGAPVLPVAEARGRLCGRCAAVVKALE